MWGNQDFSVTRGAPLKNALDLHESHNPYQAGVGAVAPFPLWIVCIVYFCSVIFVVSRCYYVPLSSCGETYVVITKNAVLL